MTTHTQHNSVPKTSVWLAFGFYLLIGFEFFYMISPFAVYFYSVYQPGLEFINNHPSISWLGATFLPHIVSETSSPLLNNITPVGFILTFGGGALFIFGAIQVYWNKLRKKSVVVSGLYIFVRHPQYTALIIAGLGMLILWPRYIVLLSYVSMLFVYYHLARHEERECFLKYGSSYQSYMEKTPMFIPFAQKLPRLPQLLSGNNLARRSLYVIIYFSILILSVQTANLLRSWALDQLYARYDQNSATISVTSLSSDNIAEILAIAMDDDTVREHIRETESTDRLINYIVPLDWSASEIPMQQIEGFDHFGYLPPEEANEHKIVFTRSIPDTEKKLTGKEIIEHSKDRLPLLEIIVNRKSKLVSEILPPLQPAHLESVPLPIF
ncbi:MAG: isoprenylcysteine carboxylmethyltransferase family protein [Desulfobulbaceae bacterium]|nr:MAG: isoprenylcysteine carboxylmethyltransferase family protein [Desulfobulbaceae bacterium]